MMIKGIIKIFLILTVMGMLMLSSVDADQELMSLFRKGQEAYHQGHYKEAINQFEKVVDMDPNFAPVYNALGQAHQQIGSRLSDVVWFYKVAIDLEPDCDEAYDNMCKAYSQAQEFDLAEKACLDALSLNPGMGSSQLSLAWIYLAGKQQPHDAIYYFRKVLEKVENPNIYFGLGMAYSMLGDHAQVLDTITKLRGMGESDLAAQLEDMIRQPQAPSPRSSYQDLSVPKPQKGMLIESRPKPAPTPSEEFDSPVSGQMRIRLKGRLFGDEESEDPKKHPGSL